MAAGDPARADSEQALAELCQQYWFPVYAFVRRRVKNVEEAQDLTQSFFSTLLEKNYVSSARRQQGRFRTFLLTAVQRFVGKEWAKAKAQKRGGDKTILSLDFAWGESQLSLEPVDPKSPENEFDRQWAIHLLEIVQTRLRDEFCEAGKSAIYQRLKPYLVGDGGAVSYEEAAASLGMSVGAVKTAVYRMRRRYRDLLRSEIAQTVTDPNEIDDEVRRLFDALA